MSYTEVNGHALVTVGTLMGGEKISKIGTCVYLWTEPFQKILVHSIYKLQDEVHTLSEIFDTRSAKIAMRKQTGHWIIDKVSRG